MNNDQTEAFSKQPTCTSVKKRLVGDIAYRIDKIINHLLGARKYWMKLGRLEQYTPRPFDPDHFTLTASDSDVTLPSISLVTPSFQQGQFLERTIKSVVSQNYPKLEYVIQDGGSDDGSAEIIQRYQNKLTYWSSEPDQGQADAIKKGFNHTSGEIMAWLNSDDLLLPGVLSFIGEYFAKHPEVDVLYGNRVIIDAVDREIGRWVIPGHDPEVLAWADYVPQETLFWRKRLWDEVGGLDTSFQFALDWDLLLRFQNAGATFACLPDYLGCFRVHDEQKTSHALESVGYQEMLRLRERHNGYLIPEEEISKLTLRFRWRAVLATKLRRRYHFQP